MSDAIREKLAKLLRLARSANPHEAALARAMYSRLSARSGITVEDPDAHPTGHSELRFTVEGFDLRHKLSASLVMLEFGIGVILTRRIPKAPRTLFMVGPAEVLEPALSLFRLLAEAMGKGWEQFRDCPLYDYVMTLQRKSKVQFYQGAHHAILLRMQDARNQRTRAAARYNQADAVDSMLCLIRGLGDRPAGAALATVSHAIERRASLDRYTKDTFPGFKPETVHVTQTDTTSYRQGCRYGLKVALRDCPAIEGITL